MEYAINKITGRLESAARGSRFGEYVCPVCNMMVNHRAGKVKKPHFAHWPGWGSSECENFVPSQYTQHDYGQASAASTPAIPTVKQCMELRLLIPNGGQRDGWSVELVLPLCNPCRAYVTLDLGGRIQTIDMRSMVRRRRVTAELSLEPYRILSFSGTPDPVFFAEVDRYCLGLPSFGAAAFTASGSNEYLGFPRAKELRYFETFALLWRMPPEPNFPDELIVDRLRSRQGWNLAFVTLSETPSEACITWLKSFTSLPIAPPKPSVISIWPFLTKNSNINEVACVQSNLVLLSANLMPVGPQDCGPTMLAQGTSEILSAIGVERSPTFFILNPDSRDTVRVVEASNPDINALFSFALHLEHTSPQPSVELAFLPRVGERYTIPLHERRCTEFVSKARSRGIGLEYLSMPQGAEGILRVKGISGQSEIKLSSGSDVAPHNQHMRLLQSDVLAKLAFFWADSTYLVELEFGGFGRLYIPGSCESDRDRELPSALRSRLFSFIFQLRLVGPIAAQLDDIELIGLLADVKPELPLIPHYRALVKEVLASGFELKRFR